MENFTYLDKYMHSRKEKKKGISRDLAYVYSYTDSGAFESVNLPINKHSQCVKRFASVIDKGQSLYCVGFHGKKPKSSVCDSKSFKFF